MHSDGLDVIFRKMQMDIDNTMMKREVEMAAYNVFLTESSWITCQQPSCFSALLIVFSVTNLSIQSASCLQRHTHAQCT